jgi:septal ring factor EnvC (AmiA/AmiB activator)
MVNSIYLILGTVCSLLLSIGVIIEYNHLKVKESEEKGRLLQRLDTLEKEMEEQKRHTDTSDANYIENERALRDHAKDIERINEKLDDMKSSIEGLSAAVAELAKEVRRSRSEK